MKASDLQHILNKLGENLLVDNQFGPNSKRALLSVLKSGLDTPLTSKDVQQAAKSLNVDEAKIWTIYDVEASASPFIDGLPAILFEPHIFSRLTSNRYDMSYPNLSSKSWNRKLYPGSQSGRWNQLADAVGLDVNAGLSSASYGGFQILGSNFKVCGYSTPWDFVFAQSRTVGAQLLAFVTFVKGTGLAIPLQRGDWAAFARGYNGPAYRENKYDEKLAKAYAKRLK